MTNNWLDYKTSKRPTWKILVTKGISYLIRLLMVFCLFAAPFCSETGQNKAAWVSLIVATVGAIWIVYAIYTDEDRPK